MDDQVRTILQSIVELQKVTTQRLNELQSQAALDHWIIMRLVATSTVLSNLTFDDRGLLRQLVATVRSTTELLNDASALQRYIGLIEQRVVELND